MVLIQPLETDESRGYSLNTRISSIGRTAPIVKFSLFGTIGAKFKVGPRRYRAQQTVFSIRLGFVHSVRIVCSRRLRDLFRWRFSMVKLTL